MIITKIARCWTGLIDVTVLCDGKEKIYTLLSEFDLDVLEKLIKTSLTLAKEWLNRVALKEE